MLGNTRYWRIIRTASMHRAGKMQLYGQENRHYTQQPLNFIALHEVPHDTAQHLRSHVPDKVVYWLVFFSFGVTAPPPVGQGPLIHEISR